MTAVFSDCGRYRYVLPLKLLTPNPVAGNNLVTVILHNPSVAGQHDELGRDLTDHTSTKVTWWAQFWGFQKAQLVNPMAYQVMDKRVLVAIPDPVGPDNLKHIAKAVDDADLVVVGWGNVDKRLQRHIPPVVQLLKASGRLLWCWGTNEDGSPTHPLMLPYDTPLQLWSPP